MVKPVTTPCGPAGPDTTGTAANRRARYGRRPAQPTPAELVDETPTGPPEDRQVGRNSDRDWMLRYS